jgi:predicted hydrocarbon binding protein
MEKILTDLMNLDIPETFFQLEIKREMKGKFLNRPIMLPSKWVRGQKERLLLTGFIPHEMNTLFIDFIFEEFVEELKTRPEIYRAFYVHRKENPECKLEYNILQKLMLKTYKSLKSKLNQLNYVREIPLFKNPGQYVEYNVDKINKTILKTFVTSIDSQIPEGAALLYDIGNTLGTRMLPLFIATNLKDLLNQLSDFWTKNLLGEIKDLQFKSRKELNFSVYECFECSHMPDIGQPVCKFDEGILTKLLSSKLDKSVRVKEVECYATGQDHCTFEVSILDSDQIKKLHL